MNEAEVYDLYLKCMHTPPYFSANFDKGQLKRLSVCFPEGREAHLEQGLFLQENFAPKGANAFL